MHGRVVQPLRASYAAEISCDGGRRSPRLFFFSALPNGAAFDAERTRTVASHLFQAQDSDRHPGHVPPVFGIVAIGGLSTTTFAEEPPQFIDLSLLVSRRIPVHLADVPAVPARSLRSASGRSALINSDILIIDGNTGTQLDVPPHSVTPPESGLPNAGLVRPGVYRRRSRLAVRRRGVRHRLPRPARRPGRPAGAT